MELLETGNFSNATLALAVAPSFQIDALWEGHLRAAADTWLRSVLLGVAAAEHAGGSAQQHPDLAPARAHWAHSHKLRPNAIAARCLAVSAPSAGEAAQWFAVSWQLALSHAVGNIDLVVALANEICGFHLQQIAGGNSSAGPALDAFLASVETEGAVPARARQADGVLFAKASRAVATRACDEARAIINSSRFPTFFSARSSIADLWVTCAAHDAEVKLGRPLTPIEQHLVRVSDAGTVPAHIGPFAGKILKGP